MQNQALQDFQVAPGGNICCAWFEDDDRSRQAVWNSKNQISAEFIDFRGDSKSNQAVMESSAKERQSKTGDIWGLRSENAIAGQEIR